jgi:hypothetical protein
VSGVVQFFGPLNLQALAPAEVRAGKSGAQLYRLLTDFTCVVPDIGPITVPAGFVTDFASIPRIAWTWLSPEDPVVLFPSIVHDYLYDRSGKVMADRVLSRAECDEVLRVAMLACQARSSQAWVVYQAVRLGGASHWKS